MQIYWWQAGLYIKPETEEERKALVVLWNSLKCTDLSLEVESSPVIGIEADDQ